MSPLTPPTLTRLDPRYLLWRDERTVQFGLDGAVRPQVDEPWVERLLQRLSAGIRSGSFDVVAHGLGAPRGGAADARDAASGAGEGPARSAAGVDRRPEHRRRAGGRAHASIAGRRRHHAGAPRGNRMPSRWSWSVARPPLCSSPPTCATTFRTCRWASSSRRRWSGRSWCRGAPRVCPAATRTSANATRHGRRCTPSSSGVPSRSARHGSRTPRRSSPGCCAHRRRQRG